jgi:hypothetical protein
MELPTQLADDAFVSPNSEYDPLASIPHSLSIPPWIFSLAGEHQPWSEDSRCPNLIWSPGVCASLNEPDRSPSSCGRKKPRPVPFGAVPGGRWLSVALALGGLDNLLMLVNRRISRPPLSSYRNDSCVLSGLVQVRL